MKNRLRAAAVVMAAMSALLISGCGQRVEDTPVQTEKQTETEAVTEIIIITEAPQTEPPTETEAVTEAVTEAPVVPDEDLSAEEEAAGLRSYDESRTLYANDDINVRTEPSTEQGSETIFASYLQGDEVTVTGETPHWYRVSLSEESDGYVHKDGLSETAVEPKTDEERAAAAEQEAVNQAASADYEAADSMFAESFPVVAASAVNIRAGASEDADIMGTLPEGTTATALGETGDWYQVEYEGMVGYIHKNLVG